MESKDGNAFDMGRLGEQVEATNRLNTVSASLTPILGLMQNRSHIPSLRMNLRNENQHG